MKTIDMAKAKKKEEEVTMQDKIEEKGIKKEELFPEETGISEETGIEATPEKIQEIKDKIEFNKTADKVDQKEISLAELQLLQPPEEE